VLRSWKICWSAARSVTIGVGRRPVRCSGRHGSHCVGRRARHRLAGLNGLRLRNGSPATPDAAEGIHAVGDVARLHHEHLGAAVVLENRTDATDKAATVT
jgi:hypothetical protein